MQKIVPCAPNTISHTHIHNFTMSSITVFFFFCNERASGDDGSITELHLIPPQTSQLHYFKCGAIIREGKSSGVGTLVILLCNNGFVQKYNEGSRRFPDFPLHTLKRALRNFINGRYKRRCVVYGYRGG